MRNQTERNRQRGGSRLSEGTDSRRDTGPRTDLWRRGGSEEGLESYSAVPDGVTTTSRSTPLQRPLKGKEVKIVYLWTGDELVNPLSLKAWRTPGPTKINNL